MATLTRRPKFAADQMVTCLESFVSADEDEHGYCTAGTRLLGSNPTVTRRPHMFADANLPDDQLVKARDALYPNGRYVR